MQIRTSSLIKGTIGHIWHHFFCHKKTCVALIPILAAFLHTNEGEDSNGGAFRVKMRGHDLFFKPLTTDSQGKKARRRFIILTHLSMTSSTSKIFFRIMRNQCARFIGKTDLLIHLFWNSKFGLRAEYS